MIKICRICNNEFETKIANKLNCDKCKDLLICKICNKIYEGERHSKTCSRECADILRKKTNLERYGREFGFDYKKSRETLLKNYGVSIPLKSKQILEKLKNTNLERYGGTTPAKNNKVVEKMKNTNLERYGGTTPMSNKEIREKQRNTLIEKYGVTNSYLIPEIRIKCSENGGNIISKMNRRFSKFLKENNLDNELEFRIGNEGYDIHILNSNILLEIDPTYTHNSTIKAKSLKRHKQKDKYYHYNKTKLAIENNYICIHKFDWMTNEEILKIIESIDEYTIIQKEPRLHWYNIKTREHLLDKNFNREDMINKGFVEIYDDGV